VVSVCFPVVILSLSPGAFEVVPIVNAEAVELTERFERCLLQPRSHRVSTAQRCGQSHRFSMQRVSIGVSPGAFSSHQRTAIGEAFRDNKPL